MANLKVVSRAYGAFAVIGVLSTLFCLYLILWLAKTVLWTLFVIALMFSYVSVLKWVRVQRQQKSLRRAKLSVSEKL